MKNIVLALFLCGYPFFFLNAQSVGSDSKGKDIFTFFQGTGFKPSLNASSIKIPFTAPFGITRYYLRSPQIPANMTAIDEYSFNASVAVSNITSNLYNIFSSQNQPTIVSSIGFSVNNVDEFSNWNNLYQHRGVLREREYTLSFKLYWNAPLLNYYDTIYQTRHPNDWSTMLKLSSFGASTAWSLFYQRWFAISGTLSDEYGLPLDNLKNYQSTAPVNYSNASVISLGNYAGKIGGDIAKKSWNARVSLAIPIFLKSMFSDVGNIAGFNSNFFSKICLIPYYAPYGSHGRMWTQLVGCFVEVLQNGYGGLNSTISPAFGLGIDWQTDNKAAFGKPTIFFSGTFNLTKPSTPTLSKTY